MWVGISTKSWRANCLFSDFSFLLPIISGSEREAKLFSLVTKKYKFYFLLLLEKLRIRSGPRQKVSLAFLKLCL